jgi:hypothetical protein
LSSMASGASSFNGRPLRYSLLPTTPYYSLLLPTTPYYSSLLPTTPYYSLLLPTTPYYSLLLPTTPYHSLPLPTTPSYTPSAVPARTRRPRASVWCVCCCCCDDEHALLARCGLPTGGGTVAATLGVVPRGAGRVHRLGRHRRLPLGRRRRARRRLRAPGLRRLRPAGTACLPSAPVCAAVHVVSGSPLESRRYCVVLAVRVCLRERTDHTAHSRGPARHGPRPSMV